MECKDKMKEWFEEMPCLLESLKSLHMSISWIVTGLQVPQQEEESNKTRVVQKKDFWVDMV